MIEKFITKSCYVNGVNVVNIVFKERPITVSSVFRFWTYINTVVPRKERYATLIEGIGNDMFSKSLRSYIRVDWLTTF